MSITRKLALTSFISLLAIPLLFGQGASSPFTTLGLGQPFGNDLVQNQGMAGVGIATPQYWYLNNINPALLAYNTLTVFSAGALYESRTIKADTLDEKSSGGNIGYLAMAFPIRPKDVTRPHRWTTSFGLTPYTKVAYRFRYTEAIGNTSDEEVLVTQKGSGGFSRFYLANGYRIKKGLAVGLRASYIFGSITDDYSNVILKTDPDDPRPLYVISVSEKVSVHDFAFQAGVAYTLDSLFSRKAYRFSIGATYEFGTDLKTDQTTTFSRLDSFNPDQVLDSLNIGYAEGKITIPSGFGIGVSLGNAQKWIIGLDFNFKDWSSFQGRNSEDSEALGQSWRAALGGEFTPDIYATDNLLKKMTYRAGASYEVEPFLANGKQVTDFGINFGFSVPTGRSTLDLAFRLGKRGKKAENVLEENYFKVYFGLTLNDQWFIKRKFD